MTTRRKDDPTAPPSKDRDPSAKPDLLTAEDLFGDIVDEPLRATARPAAPRKGPIKVQVSEPGGARKPSPLASPPRPGEKLPEDVAALLDAFSEPAESALREEQEQEPEEGGIGNAIEELPADPAEAATPSPEALLDAMLGTPAEEPARAATAPRREAATASAEPPPAITPADEDEDLLLGVLEPPPPAPPTPQDDADSLRDLLALRKSRPPALKKEDPREAAGPRPAARMATKFKAQAAPRKEPSGPGLDLASLAEDAFAAVDAPAPEGAEPAAEAGAAVPAASAEATAAPQRDYGPYRLLERVAVGGMAEVFRAKRTGIEGFEKVVAVKRILSHLSDNKEFVDMFIDEAKTVAGLTHPNIVQIFDLGKIEKNHYIAMEYVHGRDLRTILRRARERNLRVPLDISTYVVSKVCAALEYAHRKKDEQGRPIELVHRDISPQNILISFEGEVKLTDFGIAKAATKASTTDKGALRGKLLYMSPEQAWGKPMDRRSDVFSLGIVFYEMLTEQKPFLGTSEMSILETVRECRVPPPRTLNADIPEKLEKVLMKALERDPEERYQDAGEMHLDLERVLHERQPASAGGLVRFLEVLYDERERGSTVVEEGAGGARSGSEGLDIEPAEPASGPPVAEAPPPPPVKDPMSIQKLLKRFGIK